MLASKNDGSRSRLGCKSAISSRGWHHRPRTSSLPGMEGQNGTAIGQEPTAISGILSFSYVARKIEDEICQ